MVGVGLEGACKRVDLETKEAEGEAHTRRRMLWGSENNAGKEAQRGRIEAQRGTILRWETQEKCWGKDQREVACGGGGGSEKEDADGEAQRGTTLRWETQGKC